MTVSKLYEYMTESVVPEAVLPQNIASCLMDENAEIPELDAFTFLNRLRDLGIGSADFIYLLKSCGAPAEAVEKIESNPAMSLQGLIVTLERAGLEPKDYTRMLYSARKTWERTQTMRISAVLEEMAAQSPDSQTEQPEAIPENPVDTEQKTEDNPTEDAPTDEVSISEHLRGITVILGEEHTEIHAAEPTEEEYETEENPEQPLEVNKKGIAASAVGAVVLLGLSAVMSAGIIPPVKEEVIKLRFAENSQEIFTEIHRAYNSGTEYGGNIVSMPTDRGRVFGDMLVEPIGSDKGVFTIGGSIYSAYSDRVLIYDSETGVQSGELTPPEQCEFTEFFLRDELYAVYSGKSCGVMSLTGEEHNTELCGKLTDYTIADGKVTLASVYFIEFTESFTSEEEEKYLPYTVQNGEKRSIAAEKIILGADKAACGYAVRAEIDIKSGEVTQASAVLGDAQFSDSDGEIAVVRSESGSQIIKCGGEEIISEQAGLVTACDYADGKLCTIESDETAYIRGEDMKPASAMQNFTEQVKSAEIDGDFLYVSGESGIFMAADIGGKSAEALSLTRKSGIIGGEYTLVGDINGSEVSLVLYNSDGSEAARCSRIIVAERVSELEFTGSNAFYIGGASSCGAAYSYFDGVSFVSEFALFGAARKTASIFDDKTGFTTVFSENGEIRLIYSDGYTQINQN